MSEFNNSLPFATSGNVGGFLHAPQQQLHSGDFERLLNQAHEVYRGGDYARALQLCHAVRASEKLLFPSPLVAMLMQQHHP